MPRTRSLNLRPWMLVTFICLFVIALVLTVNRGDPLSLVTIGTRFSQGISDGSEGYDGQFVYYIARDSSTAAQYLDVPAYRFQRILLPIAGRLLAFGQESLLPWSFLFINLLAVAVGTWLLEQLLVGYKVSRWYALTYGLSIGILGSVRLSLSEPLAYGLVIGGVWLAGRDRWWFSACLFALAALAKETTLFFVGGFILYLLFQRQFLKAISLGAIAVLPFALWQLILRAHFGEFGIGSGGAMATSFEFIPFAGVVRIVTETPPDIRFQVILLFGAILTPFVIVPSLWALWRCWVDTRRGAWTLTTYLLFVNAAIMPFVPFSTYREYIGILRFIVGLQIALILYAAQHHHRRALRNSTIWITTAIFIFTLLSSQQ
jgi:hypothetical protein